MQYKSRSGCTFLLLSAVVVSAHGEAEAAFGQKPCCVMPDRAIVLYREELYVMAPGTLRILEYLPEGRVSQIAGRLPVGVQSVTNLGGGEIRGGRKRIHLSTVFAREGGKPEGMLLAPTKEGRIAIAEGKPEDLTVWQDKLVRSRRMPPGGPPWDADYEWKSYSLQCIAEGPHQNRFITVSKEKVIIKSSYGAPMEFWPLVLGEEKDAAEFQLIEFPRKSSGK